MGIVLGLSQLSRCCREGTAVSGWASWRCAMQDRVTDQFCLQQGLALHCAKRLGCSLEVLSSRMDAPACSGASLCKAHVVFHSAADAQTAMSKYNAMTLDGKPMRIRQAEQMQREPGSVLGR